MSLPYVAKSRAVIRQSIGYNLGSIIVSSASTTGSTSTLVDTFGLAKGGTEDYIGQQIIMLTATEDIVGDMAFVASFDDVNKIATFTPAFTATTTKADTYEMWETHSIEQVEDVINQAIISASDDIFKDKEDHSLYKLANIYEYTIPSDFVALHTVEYEYSVGVKTLLDDCEDVWTAGTGVAATADATFEKVGTACAKFVNTTAAAGATLCYEDISSKDISNCDKVEFWMYSSITLTAGQLQFMLGATAAIASPLETIDIPAMTAATWYKHCLTLANPHSDTAIISIGVRQKTAVDVGAFTFYLDDVNAIKENSRIFRELSPDNWWIVQATTSKLQLDETACGKIANNRMLRLSGYQKIAELSADATSCECDPDYIVAYATGRLLASQAQAKDVEDSLRRSNIWLGIAETRLREARTPLAMNCRWVGGG